MRIARPIGWLALVIGLLGSSSAGSDEPIEPTITIGVRVDTPPFAWRDDESRAFRGYLHDLCTEAVNRAGYHFDEVPVTAAARKAILDGNPVLTLAGGRKVELDLLCDPTTISIARLDKLIAANSDDPEILTFSPIVYVANGSYVTLEGFSPAAKQAHDNMANRPEFLKKNSETHESCQCLSGKCPLKNGSFRAGYVVGTTSRANIDRAIDRKDVIGLPGTRLCFEEMPSHADLLRELCGGGIQYYFGDIDIAQFYAGQSSNCKIKPADRPLSYEPYALLVSNHTPGFRPRFIAALYEMFSDQTVSGRFGTYFPGLTKSSALSILFRINSIPGMRGLSAKCEPQGGASGQGGECDDRQAQAAQ